MVNKFLNFWMLPYIVAFLILVSIPVLGFKDLEHMVFYFIVVWAASFFGLKHWAEKRRENAVTDKNSRDNSMSTTPH